MSSTNQLTKFTNKWKVMLAITLVIGGLFYFIPAIKVTNLGGIQFSTNIAHFNSLIFEQLENLKHSTYFDTFFILSYTVLFYFSYRVFQSSMRIPVSKILIILCLIPGIFDLLENVILLGLLGDADNAYLFNAFWLFVRAKWTFIIPFILINLIIFIYYILREINKNFS